MLDCLLMLLFLYFVCFVRSLLERIKKNPIETFEVAQRTSGAIVSPDEFIILVTILLTTVTSSDVNSFDDSSNKLASTRLYGSARDLL